MLSEDKSLSRERLCEKTNLSDATAKREIAFLKKTGYLERIGSLKGGYWKVKRLDLQVNKWVLYNIRVANGTNAVCSPNWFYSMR